MDQAITKLLFIAAAIAVAAAVTTIAWSAISSNTPDETGRFDHFEQIENEVLCDAAGGKWTTSNNVSTCTEKP